MNNSTTCLPDSERLEKIGILTAKQIALGSRNLTNKIMAEDYKPVTIFSSEVGSIIDVESKVNEISVRIFLATNTTNTQNPTCQCNLVGAQFKGSNIIECQELLALKASMTSWPIPEIGKNTQRRSIEEKAMLAGKIEIK